MAVDKKNTESKTLTKEQIRELLTRLVMSDEKPDSKAKNVLPTSFSRRTGKTLMTVLRSARMVRKERKNAKRGSPASLDFAQVLKIVSALGQLKGLAMKMGQMMSYLDVALPEEFQVALSTLQTHSQPMPFSRVQSIIREDLETSAQPLLAQMSETPIAAASIGQVHAARLPDGTSVAVKVRYPEVEQAIATDFGAARVGGLIQSILFPNARIREFIDEMRTRFLEECDYEHEASAQRRFRSIFEGHGLIVIPPVFADYCGRRVLTTEYLEGAHFDEFLGKKPSQAERDRLGEALFEFYIGTLFLHGLYNCDPHPGNYLFLPDGRMAILDYGCTREFDPPFVEALATLTLAVHADTPRELHQAFVKIGLVREDRDYDFDVARSLVRGFFGPLLLDKSQRIDLGEEDFSGIFQKKMKLLKLSLPGEFLFLFRIRYGLMSVLSRLGARANWYRLERRYVMERS